MIYTYNKSIAILAAWNLIFNNNKYYIMNSHYYYLKYLSEKYKKIYLLTTVKYDNNNNKYYKCIESINNIEVIELPYAKSYKNSQKYIMKYYKAIKKISSKVDIFYSRVPDPFCWMPSLLFRKNTIMHFVGDSIEVIRYNEKWNIFKKLFFIFGYLPDYLLTLIAAKRSKVYTNGYHIANKLKKFNIKANPVISSTVSRDSLDNEIIYQKRKNSKKIELKLIYLGYIRYSKGIKCLMELWNKMNNNKINFIFNVIGEGEMMNEVKEFIKNNHLENKIILYGHIDNREKINTILRESDLFIFPSLSEGSPRVVIEAMSQGVPVISTPVGALPYIFKNREDIRFFNFNNANKIVEIIQEYSNDQNPFILQSKNAFMKVKNNYTIEKFLSNIFNT
jgi:glycosyltransferase involved in cell wall biosynthesis